MNRKALVLYASKYGSTREVAEDIASTLRKSGLKIDLMDVRKVRALDAYGFIVLGAAIYYDHWHKDALNFLAKNQAALTSHSSECPRVVIFALGPTHNDEKEWQYSRATLERELAKFPWLTPVAVEMFGGRYPTRLHFPDTLVAGLPASPLHGMPASDVRDWTAIRTWASSLTQKLQPDIS